jgi:MscS family membrane protein
MSLETLSALRQDSEVPPVVGLRCETTSDQMQLVLDGIRKLLARHATIEASSIRVRFLRLGAYSLDVDIFAYILARDWAHFLEIQEELLLKITEIVNAAGTSMAFPSQTMYVENQALIAPAAEEPHRSSGEQEIRR